jgi:hypothetical protein
MLAAQNGPDIHSLVSPTMWRRLPESPMAEAPLVAVVGTVGVPARYGGFETLAEQLARHVAPTEARLVIYGQKSAYSADERVGGFAGHERRFLPLSANGAQSMLHDALAMLDVAVRLRPDAMLVLGTSGAWMLPLVRLLRPKLRVVTNVDGLEWRRDKFGTAVRRLLKLLEWCAVRASDVIVADNAGLVPIIRGLHGIEPVTIAYGGDHADVPPAPWWGEGEAPTGHWLVVARIEPENNSAMILEAAVAAGVKLAFVGNWDANSYGQALKARYAGQAGLMLLDPVYDAARLARLRQGAVGYVHGHSVGGTNPSLVEALYGTDRILAFDCVFNRATLEGVGQWFGDAGELAGLLAQPDSGCIAPAVLQKLRTRYRWRSIAVAYIEAIVPQAAEHRMKVI